MRIGELDSTHHSELSLSCLVSRTGWQMINNDGNLELPASLTTHFVSNDSEITQEKTVTDQALELITSLKPYQ